MDVESAITIKLKEDFLNKFGTKLPSNIIDYVVGTQGLAVLNSMKAGEEIRLKYIGAFHVNRVQVRLIKMLTAYIEVGHTYAEAHKLAKNYVELNILDLVKETKEERELEKDSRKKTNSRKNNMIHLPLNFNKK